MLQLQAYQAGAYEDHELVQQDSTAASSDWQSSQPSSATLPGLLHVDPYLLG